MHIERLRLTDFRNYRELDIALPRGLVVFRGRNAQGKSNLLEAISLIATSRSFRTNSEREAVRWGAPGHFARVEAEVVRRKDTLAVEVIVADTGIEAPASAVARETSSALGNPPLPACPSVSVSASMVCHVGRWICWAKSPWSSSRRAISNW